MALLTKILKLIKPDASENYSVDVWNTNSDLIDEAVGKRVIKNADIQPGKATKVTYDAKGLVTGGEQLTPDDIPALDFSKITTGRAPVLFADGKPLYGSRFVDVDENGNFVLRDDGKGDWLISVTEDGTALLTKVVTAVADNLVTEDSEAALSAKQGTILSKLIKVVQDVIDAHTKDKSNPHGTTAVQLNLGNVDNTADLDKPLSNAMIAALNLKAPLADLLAHVNDTSNGHKVTKAQVGLGNVDNTADADKHVATAVTLATARTINGVPFDGSANITITDDTKIPLSQKGTAGGVAELDENGYVPSSQLPSYVDDTIEGTLATFPKPGESGKIYVDTATRLTYRWSGTAYVEISPSVALGETSSTAYPGNKGKQNATDIAALKATTAETAAALQQLTTDTDNRFTEVGEKDNEQDERLTALEDLPTIYVDGKPIYPVTFADVVNGVVVITADGTGDYILACTPDGTVYVRNLTNNVTDPVTGDVYKLDIINSQPILTKI